jgi:hypothetical protein
MSKYETNLNAATTRFWNSLYFQDNDVLNNLISPDCSLTLKSSGTGCLGINECFRILKEIQDRIQLFEKYKSKLRFTMKLNKIKRSTRFLITSIDSTMKFNLGFQLEWECGIILAIKVIEDPSPGFLVIKKSNNLGGKSLSDIQNTLIRQQTGPCHYEWRKKTIMIVTGVVLPKDKHERLYHGGLVSEGNKTLEVKKVRYEYEGTVSDLTEIHLVDPSCIRSRSRTCSDPSHPSPPIPPPPPFIYPGEEIHTNSESSSLSIHNPTVTSPTAATPKLKFSPRTEALLVPDRTELPCKELFYNASDFQLFAIDYGDEIKEIMTRRRVSPQQAIAIYHSIPFHRPSALSSAHDTTTTGEPGGEDVKGKSRENMEREGEEEGDLESSDPPTIPPVLVSSLKAEVENERTERERRNTLSSEAPQQKKGWYPGTHPCLPSSLSALLTCAREDLGTDQRNCDRKWS